MTSLKKDFKTLTTTFHSKLDTQANDLTDTCSSIADILLQFKTSQAVSTTRFDKVQAKSNAKFDNIALMMATLVKQTTPSPPSNSDPSILAAPDSLSPNTEIIPSSPLTQELWLTPV